MKRPFLPYVRAQTHMRFSQVTLIKPIYGKTSRRLRESAVISKTKHLKQRPGFYQISPYLSNIILNENKIKIEKGWRKKTKKTQKHLFTLCNHIFENPFLFLITLPLSPSSPQLPPRHHNIDKFQEHHIIINIFPWNKMCRNHFHPNPSLPFSYQLPKIYLQFQNKKSLMKPDTFEKEKAFKIQFPFWKF